MVRVLRARLAGDPQRVDALRLEAQTLGRLGHPHIAAVKGAGTTVDGRPFIVHEFLEGSTLAEELAAHGGRLPVLEALAYESQLLSALSAAHEVGIAHGNLDPKNLFVCRGPEGQPRIKLLEFGRTRMSPNARADAERVDVECVASLLYGMLTGRGSFEVAEPRSTLALDSLSPEVDQVLRRALSNDSGERFRSAEAFRDRLEALASEHAVRGARSRALVPLLARRGRGSLTFFFLAALAASAGVVLALRALLGR